MAAIPLTPPNSPVASLDDDALYALARTGTLFALCDPLDVPAVLERSAAMDPARVAALYDGGFDAIAPRLWHASPAELDWIGKHLDPMAWGCCLVADAPLPVLLRHLHALLSVSDPRGETVHFRFYDPRVLGPFLPCCDETERRQVFGPVERFIVPAEDGWRAWSAPKALPVGAFGPAPRWPFRLRPEHLAPFDAQILAGFAPQIVAHLRARRSPGVAGRSDDALEERVREGIDQARALGLRSPRALTAFVTLFFEVGPTFHRHPYIRFLLENTAQAPEARMEAVLTRVPAAVWKEARDPALQPEPAPPVPVTDPPSPTSEPTSSEPSVTFYRIDIDALGRALGSGDTDLLARMAQERAQQQTSWSDAQVQAFLHWRIALHDLVASERGRSLAKRPGWSPRGTGAMFGPAEAEALASLVAALGAPVGQCAIPAGEGVPEALFRHELPRLLGTFSGLHPLLSRPLFGQVAPVKPSWGGLTPGEVSRLVQNHAVETFAPLPNLSCQRLLITFWDALRCAFAEGQSLVALYE